MEVRKIMTKDVACCTPDTPLQEVARMMVECDCGAIPVVEDGESNRPVGIVTDRDICCRTVADGTNPLELTARDVMSSPVVTVTEDTSIDDCCNVMEENLIRRVLVVDAQGACCGIVAQADIARKGSKRATAEVVKKVSEPTPEPSRVAVAQPS